MTKPKVARIWQGRTKASRAGAYMRYMYEHGVKKIRATKGNLGVQVFRRVRGKVAEFWTVSYWSSRKQIHAYAGKDIGKPHHLAKDADFLLELPRKVQHFDILVSEWRKPRWRK